jgi:hypothetical protein
MQVVPTTTHSDVLDSHYESERENTHKTRSTDINTPSTDIYTPSTDIYTPSTDIYTPAADIYRPAVWNPIDERSQETDGAGGVEGPGGGAGGGVAPPEANNGISKLVCQCPANNTPGINQK